MHILMKQKMKAKTVCVCAFPIVFLPDQLIESPERTGSQAQLVENFLIKFHINIIIHMFCCWLRSRPKDITILLRNTTRWVQGKGR